MPKSHPSSPRSSRSPVVVALVTAAWSAACGPGCHARAGSARVEAAPAPIASSAPTPPPPFPGDWPFRQGDPAPHSSRTMVVTDAVLATKVGSDMLAGGGNAVDAAVASAFALAVVFPTAGNVGGGGFLVARVGGKSYALDFRETAPSAASRDMYVGPDGKATQDTRVGFRSAGVPGTVAGLWEVWNKLGSKRKTWAEVLAPAAGLAESGFSVDAPFAKTIETAEQKLARFPASAALFLPGGAPPAVGTTWRNPDLAGLLRRIAAEGPSAFYSGSAADVLGRAMKDGGGIMTAADLRAYQAKWRDPLEYHYRGRTLVGMPPPSSGAITMAMIVGLLTPWDLRALGWHSAGHVHLVAECMRRAFAARNARLGDPDFVKNPVAELLSDDWARDQGATILKDRATPTQGLFPSLAPRSAGGTDTTHMAVVDAEGNAVALTTTVNTWFGSGVTVPGLGFVLNDEMDDFATVPGTPNGFGLVQGEPNAIAPGKRMLSSMSPTIVLDASGAVDLVLGAAGGSRIISTTFEVLSNVVDFGMEAADAVRAPRFHQQDLPDVLETESRALPDDVRHALEAMGHATKDREHIADAPTIGKSLGLWEGAAEPRRDGSIAIGL